MKKQNLPFLLILILPLCFGGCASQEQKAAAKAVTEFFDALKRNDSLKLSRIYPSIHSLSSWCSSDSAVITAVKKSNDQFVFKVHNSFSNEFEKIVEKDIEVFITVKNETAIIEDSKGLMNNPNEELYAFAHKTGCIKNEENTLDQQYAKLMKEADLLYSYLCDEFENTLKREVPISDIHYNNEFGIDLGKATITNNSDINIYDLQYKLACLDIKGNALKTDQGYVCFDTITPHSKRTFEFTSLSPDNTKKIELQLVYSKNFIMNRMKNYAWTGEEYEQWKKQNLHTKAANM